MARAYLRLFKDPESSTGMSAAVIVKNVRPVNKSDGRFDIVSTRFRANFMINCEGYKTKPEVDIKIWAQLGPSLIKHVQKKKRLERAMLRSPMLFE